MLPLTVWITGGPELSEATPPDPLQRGPVKILITDHAFPSLDQLSEGFIRAHGAGRAVAVHCVSRAGLLLALAAWQDVGSVPGDGRACVGGAPEVVAALGELSLTVVTQPGFLAARGDGYLAEVEPVDRPDLYRCASLRGRGAGGREHRRPFRPDDPWFAIRAAIERRAAERRNGRVGPGTVAGGGDEPLFGSAGAAGGSGAARQPGGGGRPVPPRCPVARGLLDPASHHVYHHRRGARTYAA